MMHEQAGEPAAPVKKRLANEQDYFRRCSTEPPRILDGFSSGLCEGTASGKRVARGKTGEQSGPASGFGLPGLSSGEPEGLWAGGWYQHTSLRPHQGSRKSDAGLRGEEVPGGPFAPPGSHHREAGNGRFWSSGRFTSFTCEDSASHNRFLRRTATIGGAPMKTETRVAIRVEIRALLLGLASATALLAEVDAREIIRRVVETDERNWKVARNYGFSERVDARRLDSREFEIQGREDVRRHAAGRLTLPAAGRARRPPVAARR